MFGRLLLESLRRGKRRKLLAATAVAVGTFAVIALGSLLLASGDRLAAEMSSYGANIELVPEAEAGTFDVAELNKLRTIFWRNNIEAVAPFYPLRVSWKDGRSVAPLVGTWFDHRFADGWRSGLGRVRPSLELTGRWPRPGAAEVALGHRLATQLAVRIGDEVPVAIAQRRERLRVVGLVTSGGSEDEQGFAPLGLVNELGGRHDRAVRAELFALTNPETPEAHRDPATMSAKEYDKWYCTAYPSSVALNISRSLNGVKARVVRAVTGASGEILGQLRAVLLLMAAVILIGTAVGVTAAMTATVLERRIEAGLMVAIGAEGRQIALFFLTEAALLGLVGGLVGGVLGAFGGRALGRWVFGLAVPFNPTLIGPALILGVLVAVLGSLPPVIRALRSLPAQTLARATS